MRGLTKWHDVSINRYTGLAWGDWHDVSINQYTALVWGDWHDVSINQYTALVWGDRHDVSINQYTALVWGDRHDVSINQYTALVWGDWQSDMMLASTVILAWHEGTDMMLAWTNSLFFSPASWSMVELDFSSQLCLDSSLWVSRCFVWLYKKKSLIGVDLFDYREAVLQAPHDPITSQVVVYVAQDCTGRWKHRSEEPSHNNSYSP